MTNDEIQSNGFSNLTKVNEISEFSSVKSSDEMTEEQVYDSYMKSLKSKNFLILFLMVSCSMSITYVYQINIKNFGLQYFEDSSVSKTSIFATVFFFTFRFGIGALVDKFGMSACYKVMMLV